MLTKTIDFAILKKLMDYILEDLGGTRLLTNGKGDGNTNYVRCLGRSPATDVLAGIQHSNGEFCYPWLLSGLGLSTGSSNHKHLYKKKLSYPHVSYSYG